MRKSFLLSTLLLSNLLSPVTAYAQSNTVSASTGLLQIFLALSFVIALMLLLAWLFKRVGPINNSNKLPMNIIGGISIGNRERVMVIEVAGQWLVLGVTAQQINTLATMPKQELPVIESTTNPLAAPFSDWLKKTIEKRNTSQN